MFWFNQKKSKAAMAPALSPKQIDHPRQLVIGQPVIAIIEEMKNIDAWEFDCCQNVVRLIHNKNKLTLKFYVDRYTTVEGRPYVDMWDTSWATKDEKKTMCAALHFVIEERSRIEMEYEHMRNQIEREKYVVFVKE
jgi:hypothetical protein